MILIATGLKREARLLAGPGAKVVAGGGDSARLEAELEAAAGRAAGILSMGLCGALAEGLRPGDWVVASALVSPSPPAGEGVGGADGWGVSAQAPPARESITDAQQTPPPDPLRGPPSPQGGRRWLVDAVWASALAGKLDARLGPVFASDAMITDAPAKQALYAQTHALAADMESHVAAAVAARHGLSFAVARVVSDGAERSLPRAAQAGMAPDGRMDVGAVIRALAGRPWELPALIRVGAEAETAFRALGRGRHLLGPGLGRPDLG